MNDYQILSLIMTAVYYSAMILIAYNNSNKSNKK